MASLREIKEVKNKVEYLLKDYPHTRDDDNKLIANIWFNEIKDINNMSAKEFLKQFSEGKFTSTESIGRARRKLQEENISLRGEKYKARMAEEEKIRVAVINNEL